MPVRLFVRLFQLENDEEISRYLSTYGAVRLVVGQTYDTVASAKFVFMSGFVTLILSYIYLFISLFCR